jgi:hypothetical protein
LMPHNYIGKKHHNASGIIWGRQYCHRIRWMVRHSKYKNVYDKPIKSSQAPK